MSHGGPQSGGEWRRVAGGVGGVLLSLRNLFHRSPMTGEICSVVSGISSRCRAANIFLKSCKQCVFARSLCEYIKWTFQGGAHTRLDFLAVLDPDMYSVQKCACVRVCARTSLFVLGDYTTL